VGVWENERLTNPVYPLAMAAYCSPLGLLTGAAAFVGRLFRLRLTFVSVEDGFILFAIKPDI